MTKLLYLEDSYRGVESARVLGVTGKGCILLDENLFIQRLASSRATMDT